MYYVPSLEKEVIFKPLTIGQFKIILNEDFNSSFINVLKENCTKATDLTNFDKEIILLQIHLNEIKETPVTNKIVEHPKEQVVEEGFYKITIAPLILTQELEAYSYANTLNKNDKDSLLLVEIAKYINTLVINNEEINWNISFISKIKILKDIPIQILANCVLCIDSIKKQIKAYYQQNNIDYRYDISLLVP